MKKGSCGIPRKIAFPIVVLALWNGLKDEIVEAESVHEYQARPDNKRYEDRTQRIQLH